MLAAQRPWKTETQATSACHLFLCSLATKEGLPQRERHSETQYPRNDLFEARMTTSLTERHYHCISNIKLVVGNQQNEEKRQKKYSDLLLRKRGQVKVWRYNQISLFKMWKVKVLIVQLYSPFQCFNIMWRYNFHLVLLKEEIFLALLKKTKFSNVLQTFKVWLDKQHIKISNWKVTHICCVETVKY